MLRTVPVVPPYGCSRNSIYFSPQWPSDISAKAVPYCW
jgi:hypothetical protein